MLTKCLFYFLLLCNLVLPIIIIARRLVLRRGVEFDHVFLFSCGFIFYWILPIAFGLTNYYTDYNTANCYLWYSVFDKLTDYKLITYMIWTLVFYISFIIGGLLSGNKVAKVSSSKRCPLDKRLLNIPLFIGIIMAIYSAYPLWDKFFTGYRISPLYSETGPLTAVTAFLLSMAFMYVTDIHKESCNSLQFCRLIFNKAFIVYLIMTMLLVSLGGRLVFVSSIIMILVLYSVYFKRVKLSYAVLILFAIIIASHMITMFRMNFLKGAFSPTNYAIRVIFAFLFSDNINVSFSFINFLNDYALPALQFPSVLLSQLISIIPTFIFPGKVELFLHYNDLGYEIFSPSGGCSSFVSLVINFGAVGALIFLFCFAFFLGWLKTKRMQPHQTMYVMTCGWLAISFFRTFEMAMIKLILQFSILIPFLITTTLVIINNMRHKKDG